MNKDRMIQRMCEMIRIDSVSLHEKEMADWLEKYFTNRGAEIYRDECGKRFGGNTGNLLVHVKGTMPGEAICFSAHMDTVEPGNGIEPVTDVNKAYVESASDTILGADDKCGIAAILEAYETIRESNTPHREMYFLFSVCEEAGMLGVKNFDFAKLKARHVVAIDSSGPAGTIASAAPAKKDISIRFIGKKAHAGIEPEKGISAICMAAEAISNMSLGRIDAETTANLGRIEGGGATNIVTDLVSVTGAVRSHSIEKLDGIVAAMKDICMKTAEIYGGNVEFEATLKYPCLKLDADSFIYKHCAAAYSKEGIALQSKVIGGGSDANVLSPEGFECAVISCGMEKVHTKEERLDIEELYKTANAVFNMMTM